MTNASPSADREIVTTRLIDAPRETVWEAWSNLEHLERWYGPDGFSVTTSSFDFSVGGEWRFTMHGPDGRDYPNVVLFTDIAKPERIAHDHGDGIGAISFKATVTLEDRGGKTFLTLRSVFDTPEALRKVVEENGAIEGAKQTLGRLAEHVATL